MSLTKITNIFSAATTDADGNAKRLAGFTESFYATLDIASLTLRTNWTTLCQLRAALMPTNVSIIGGRFQTVDPNGPSRSFDNAFPPAANTGQDLPSVALQWTVRSTNSNNERSIILRGTPDARVLAGEYSPSAAYNAALVAYFTSLKANWGFRTINRALLPIRVVSISADGLCTTATPHGLVAGDTARFMSVVTSRGEKFSDDAIVMAAPAPTATTFTIFTPRVDRDQVVSKLQNSTRGKVRKIAIEFHSFEISNDEIVHPTAITRKAGAPLKKFRGRRSTKR